MKNARFIDCLEYSVFADRLKTIYTKQKTLVSTINQYSYCIVKKDDQFMNALQNSDVLLPDGIEIVRAARFLYGKKIKKEQEQIYTNFF